MSSISDFELNSFWNLCVRNLSLNLKFIKKVGWRRRIICYGATVNSLLWQAHYKISFQRKMKEKGNKKIIQNDNP